MLSPPPLTTGAERLTIRPLTADDREALATAFERMGEASRYKRFLCAMPRLTESQLRYLTNVDQRDHVALAAIHEDESIVGVARFIRVGASEAELAIAVVDDFQGRGLGTALIDALAERSRQAGVSRFEATVLADNLPVLRLLSRLGQIERFRVGGALHVTVDLARSSSLSDPRAAGREFPAAAAGR